MRELTRGVGRFFFAGGKALSFLSLLFLFLILLSSSLSLAFLYCKGSAGASQLRSVVIVASRELVR